MMADKFWKAKERRILRLFGLTRIGGTGHKNPDGRGDNVAIEIFTHAIPDWLAKEFAQAENCLADSQNPNEFIPWVIWGPKQGKDGECFIATKLKYFPTDKVYGPK